MEDLINRRDAINAIDDIESEVADGDGFRYEKWRQYFCELPSAEPESCEYWDAESNYCALSRPSADIDLSEYSDRLWKAAYERGKAEAEPGWIPVTERLPEIGEKVLVSTKYTVFTQVFKRIYGTPDRWGWEHNTIKKVTAWMPLPTPWKGEDDG